MNLKRQIKGLNWFNLPNRLIKILLALCEKLDECCEEPTSSLTGFQASAEKSNGCRHNDIVVPINTTYYHNGTEPLPQVGDTVFVDAEGTTPLITSSLPQFMSPFPVDIGDAIYTGQGGIVTDSNGVSVTFTCR